MSVDRVVIPQNNEISDNIDVRVKILRHWKNNVFQLFPTIVKKHSVNNEMARQGIIASVARRMDNSFITVEQYLGSKLDLSQENSRCPFKEIISNMIKMHLRDLGLESDVNLQGGLVIYRDMLQDAVDNVKQKLADVCFTFKAGRNRELNRRNNKDFSLDGVKKILTNSSDKIDKILNHTLKRIDFDRQRDKDEYTVLDELRESILTLIDTLELKGNILNSLEEKVIKQTIVISKNIL